MAPQRVHAAARTAASAGDHREVGDRNDRGRALAVLGDAKPVIDRAVAAGGIEPGRIANGLGRNAGDLLHLFRAVALV